MPSTCRLLRITSTLKKRSQRIRRWQHQQRAMVRTMQRPPLKKKVGHKECRRPCYATTTSFHDLPSYTHSPPSLPQHSQPPTPLFPPKPLLAHLPKNGKKPQVIYPVCIPPNDDEYIEFKSILCIKDPDCQCVVQFLLFPMWKSLPRYICGSTRLLWGVSWCHIMEGERCPRLSIIDGVPFF